MPWSEYYTKDLYQFIRQYQLYLSNKEEGYPPGTQNERYIILLCHCLQEAQNQIDNLQSQIDDLRDFVYETDE